MSEATMSERSQRLTGLARRLERAVPGGARVRLPADDQLVVSRDMVRGGLPRIGKWRRHVPRSGGYEIYVSCRAPADQAAMDALSQRTTFGTPPARWDRHTMRLRAAESELAPQWRVLSGRGEVVTVRVACGSTQVLDEVNRILAEIEAVLLA